MRNLILCHPFSSRSRDQQHRAQQQLDKYRGFGRLRRSASPADRLQGRRSILPGDQHRSRSTSARHGGADPAPCTLTGCLPCASASTAAANSQWIAILDHAAQDFDRSEEEKQYVSRHHHTRCMLVCLSACLVCPMEYHFKALSLIFVPYI